CARRPAGIYGLDSW
nr:immunoglobulin heavy chain junction region [Macaca mulatta]MOW86607.1 immunoglobulin heavy chain junction region [Macaca mulatta]MOW86614.1 immunoglobulin heavy chain junction region [Macaca mulatta]MOW86661.1 immunoglobulin heavy chain junction region [Macaca mulatta]MOW86765.1 immunoglobulin heavy chain junction region [Macaca mulatta]